MVLKKLTGYEGEAEVLGTLKTVAWRNDTLTIGQTSLEETNKILTFLSVGALHGVVPGTGEHVALVQAAALSQSDTPPAQPPTTTGDAAPAKRRGRPPKAETEARKAAAKAAEVSSDTDDAEEEEGEEDEDEEALPVPPKPPKKAAPPPAAVEDEDEDFEDEDEDEDEDDAPAPASAAQALSPKALRSLAGLPNVPNVLQSLVEYGYTTKEALYAKCLEIHDSVPALARIPKDTLETRIYRMATALGIAGE